VTEPFIAEIRMFAGNFAPNGWALCDGQLMSISQNTALFSLLGTTYGGNGTTNFGLPDLQGCAPMQQGQGPGLTERVLGETAGEQTATLTAQQMAAHPHLVNASTTTGTTGSPGGAAFAKAMFGKVGANIYSTAAPNIAMNPQTTGINGGGQPHNNMPPYLAVNFIIALVGIFPSRP
jgi:microcystin-dependent protein